MGKLTANEAYSRVSNYDSEIESMVKSLKDNFSDMDFENADKRTDMENIVDEIIAECNRVEVDLDNLHFES